MFSQPKRIILDVSKLRNGGLVQNHVSQRIKYVYPHVFTWTWKILKSCTSSLLVLLSLHIITNRVKSCLLAQPIGFTTPPSFETWLATIFLTVLLMIRQLIFSYVSIDAVNHWIVLEIRVQLLLRLERKRIENDDLVNRTCDLLFQMFRAHEATKEPEASACNCTLLFIYYIRSGIFSVKMS